MKNNTLSPLLLQSTLSAFSTIGSVSSAQPLDIYNPNKTAMLVDQIRFSFDLGADPAAISAYAQVAIAVEILLGSIPITKQYVTLGALAPRYLGLTAQADNGTGPAGDAVLTWHLPKPLYVPPMVQLVINAKRQPGFPGDAAAVTIPALRVTVAGRSLPHNYPVPGSIDIPWVAETKCDTAVSRFVSADSDLVNANGVPLNVTQFVGVNYNNVWSGVTPTDLTVQMSLSNGTMLIRDQVPFFLAFPADRCILPVNARLQPGAFVRVELEASPPVGAETYDDVGFTAVAMHGYRTVQTPGTLG